MKKLNVNRATVTAALIVAAGFSGVSSAHEKNGTLTAVAGAIDVYHTSCFTWSATGAAAATIINGDNEVALPAGRVVGRVAKQCATANAACGAASNTVSLTIAVKDSSPTTPVATSATATTSTATGTGTNTNAGTTNPANWVSVITPWVQVANNGTGANSKNGDYLVAVSHSSAVANPYWAQFHCEAPAVGASPAPNTPTAGHVGTGVTATGGTIASPFTGNGTNGQTDGDFNQVINQ